MRTVKQTVTALDNAVAELTERATRATAGLEAKLARLTAEVERTERRLARGTADLSEASAAAEFATMPTIVTKRPALPNHTVELEAVLRTMPLSVVDAADALGIPVAHAAIAMRALKAVGKVYNVGTNDQPQWTWIIGGEASTTDLMVEVEKLLKLPRAWTLQELVAATGCGHNRISGVRMRLMKAGLRVRNVGNNWRGQWTANPAVR